MDQAFLFLPFSFDFEKTFTILCFFYLGLVAEQEGFFSWPSSSRATCGPAAHVLLHSGNNVQGRK